MYIFSLEFKCLSKDFKMSKYDYVEKEITRLIIKFIKQFEVIQYNFTFLIKNVQNVTSNF